MDPQLQLLSLGNIFKFNSNLKCPRVLNNMHIEATKSTKYNHAVLMGKFAMEHPLRIKQFDFSWKVI